MTPVLTRGRFISLEGGEGAGKSTQARMLAEALRARSIDVLLTREPGGTPGAEAIRALLLHPPEDMGGEGWGAPAEALLFAAARADHVERAILPALRAGQWVVCDRFVDSSRAYQGGGGGITDAELLMLHGFGSLGLLPDRTFLLTLGSDEAARRLSIRDAGGADRMGSKSADYQARLAARFAEMAASEPERWRVIDAAAPVEIVTAKMMAELEQWL